MTEPTKNKQIHHKGDDHMRTVVSVVLTFTMLLAPWAYVFASGPPANPPHANQATLQATPEMSQAEYLKAFRQWAEEKHSIQNMPPIEQAECTWLYVDIWGLHITFVLDIRGAGCGAGGGGGWAF